MSIDTMDLAKKKDYILRLLDMCPVDEPLFDCTAGKLRGLSQGDRREVVKRMSVAVVDDILASHKECMRKRKKLN